MKTIVGIDVSKNWLDVAWIDNERTITKRFDYTSKGLNQLLKATPSDATYVMEATGIYHIHLAISLFDNKRKVSVVNPLVIKRYGEMHLSRVKTDSADAVLILNYGQVADLKFWHPEPQHIQEMKAAQRWLEDLIEERTRLKNRTHAQSYLVVRTSLVDKQQARRIAQIDQDITYLENQVKKHYAELYDLLTTIPSIGNKTATQLIIITCGFTKFNNIKQLSAYTGVSPTTYRSGSSVRGRGGIAKMGQGRLRQLLYICSWTARKCNPACKILYERMKDLGKPSKVINIAIAHKLLRQVFAVATKREAFSMEYA